MNTLLRGLGWLNKFGRKVVLGGVLAGVLVGLLYLCNFSGSDLKDGGREN